METLDLILVNRNSGSLLQKCIDSIEQINRDGFELFNVIVVDDDSTDGSAQGLKYRTLPLRIIYNRKRLGYGKSCNVGAGQGRGEYILFLNTDTRLMRNSILIPIQFMAEKRNKDVAIVGIMLKSELGEVSRHCSCFPSYADYFIRMLALYRLFPDGFTSNSLKDWDHLSSREVDQVLGAFMMIRRSVFQEVRGYDERFFVYFEDLDLSLRMHQLGYKSIYLSQAKAFHAGGGTARSVWAESLFFNLRSRIQYGYKHFKWYQATLLMIGTLFIEPFIRLIWAVGKRSKGEVISTMLASIMLWCNIPSLLYKVGEHDNHNNK